MVKFGEVSITNATQKTNAYGGKYLSFDVHVTTIRNTTAERIYLCVGFKYAYGNGDINYERARSWFEPSGQYDSVRGWSASGVTCDCDFLFCGGTFSFYIKATSADDVALSAPVNVLLPPNFNIPSNNYMIPERPTQQTQEVYYSGRYQGEAGCCVASALAAAKEVQEIRSGRGTIQNSVGWFFGATADNDDGTTYATALNFLQNTGMMPFRYVDAPAHVSNYPDVYFYTDRSGYTGARTLYQNNRDNAKSLPQKIRSWRKLTESDTFFNWQGVIDAIQRASGNGSSTVLVTLGIDAAIDAARADGIVGDSRGGWRAGHMMLVLGWRAINGRMYWVCQNSWGSHMGDDGIYYIPFTNVRGGTFEGFWTGICDFYEIVDDPSAPELPTPSVEPWDWNISNGTASAAATRKAYSAVTSKGPTTDFSYLVWNDLVNKVNEAAVAAGDAWVTTYATLAQTRASAADRTLTAKRFNALRQNIGSRVSTGITEVRKGDTVYGNYFTTLADKLDQWIDKL